MSFVLLFPDRRSLRPDSYGSSLPGFVVWARCFSILVVEYLFPRVLVVSDGTTFGLAESAPCIVVCSITLGLGVGTRGIQEVCNSTVSTGQPMLLVPVEIGEGERKAEGRVEIGG